MKIILYRGPLDGQVKNIAESRYGPQDILTFNYMSKRKHGRQGAYWVNTELADPNNMDTLTVKYNACLYRLAYWYDTQTGTRFPAMRPDGAVFYEWTDARKDNNLRGPFNRYQRY